MINHDNDATPVAIISGAVCVVFVLAIITLILA